MKTKTLVNHATSVEIEVVEPEGTATWFDIAGGTPKVRAESEWWGFEIYLNRYAVRAFDTILEVIEKAANLLPEPVGLMVEAYILSRKLWIELVTHEGETGCKITSPWVVPGAMVPTSWDDGEGSAPQPPPEPPLKWTVYDLELGMWSPQRELSDCHSADRPAMTVCRTPDGSDELFCVHRSGIHGQDLRYTTYNTGTKQWRNDTPMPDHRSRAEPAVTRLTLNQHVLCVYCAPTGQTDQLQYDVWTGGSWYGGRPIATSVRSGVSPALTDHYLVFSDTARGGQLSYLPYDHDPSRGFDLMKWPDRAIDILDLKTQDPPAVAWLGNLLVVMYRPTEKRDSMRYIVGSPTGSGPFYRLSWGEPKTFRDRHSEAPASLWTHDNVLYCLRRGPGTDDHLYLTKGCIAEDVEYGTIDWSEDEQLPEEHRSATGASLCFITEHKAPKGQILCLYKGDEQPGLTSEQ
jgi:hypothetical protein